MENNFKGRVDQVFGALFQSSSRSDQRWSLSDEQVKKKQWRRDEADSTRQGNPCASSFEGLMPIRSRRTNKKKAWDGPSDSDNDEDSNNPASDEVHSDDEGRQMRSVVGLDSTLDQEDEEDEFDKVAVGREDAGERTYMREIMDCSPKINSHNALPSSLSELKNAGRDPRANHLAARARLEEDDEEAAANSDLEMVDKPHLAEEEEGATLNAGKEAEDLMHEINDISTQRDSASPPLQEIKLGIDIKSIMKVKQKQMESQQALESEPPPLEDAIVGGKVCSPTANSGMEKPKKRVRFEPGCKGDPARQIEEKNDVVKGMNSEKRSLVRGGGSSDSSQDVYSRVPDYVKNPSKYIHYTLDWSNEDDDRLNMQAFKDFSQLVKPSGFASTHHVRNSVELPKSVTFIPRKKLSGTEKTRESLHDTRNGQNTEKDSSASSNQSVVLPIGIAAGHVIENEAPALGNDLGDSDQSGILNRNARLQRSTRQYRHKAKAYEETSA